MLFMMMMMMIKIIMKILNVTNKETQRLIYNKIKSCTSYVISNNKYCQRLVALKAPLPIDSN